MNRLPDPTMRVATTAYRHDASTAQSRILPEECAVAISYDRVGYAVMMATPCDLEDFAVGFSLSEGIIDRAGDCLDCDIVVVEQGIECRMHLTQDVSQRLARRKRHLAGALGCGLCGLESLAEATRAIPLVRSTLGIAAPTLMRAIRDMAAAQTLNRATHGTHAAGFLDPADGTVLVREDVGRHNALDKVIGAVARAGRHGGSGAIVLTSRISIELIQKCAMLGAPIITAVSVPTAYALRAADAAGITLVAIARDDGFEVFTHPSRVPLGVRTDVA